MIIEINLAGQRNYFKHFKTAFSYKKILIKIDQIHIILSQISHYYKSLHIYFLNVGIFVTHLTLKIAPSNANFK